MNPVTVAQVNEYIAKKLRDDYNLKGLPVVGEISAFSRSGPHFYFTLKDADSMIKCAIWGSNAKNIDMNLLENGKKIVVIADISPYPKGGNYSLSVRHVEPAGDGDLMAEFNRIKAKLQEEGLFDRKYKKEIPAFPYRIGVITSNTGAAIEDIKKIITAKNNLTHIVIFPTLVQGIGAAESICKNIELANRASEQGFHIDTLIVGRGGGSPEDLAAFNDEKVARAIFASNIPVISAVGHESDVSISDFVADLRAETPTAAADIAVMNTFELQDIIADNISVLNNSIKLKIESERNILNSGLSLLHSNIKSKTNDARLILEKAMITIQENNPENILNKGYSAVLDSNDKVIPDSANIVPGNDYKIVMRDGSFKARAVSVERK